MGNDNAVQAEWMVLINPAAGDHKVCDGWGRIALSLAQNNIASAHCFTEYPRHSLQLIRNFLEQGYRKFIIAGGDGLLNEAVNAVFTQTVVNPELVTLAVIPLGTGNDWARTFNIPFDHEAAVKVISNRKT